MAAPKKRASGKKVSKKKTAAKKKPNAKAAGKKKVSSGKEPKLPPAPIGMPEEMWRELVEGMKEMMSENPEMGPDQIIDQLLGSETQPSDAAQQAQEYIYQMADVETAKQRYDLAMQALSTSLDCADGWNFLANEVAQSDFEALAFCREGVRAGERALGERFMEDNAGHFWGLIETRPYMRARAGLAQTLWDLGQHEEAAEVWEGTLRLNPNDNQGIRYLLLNACLWVQDLEGAKALVDQYPDDCAAWMTYGKVLYFFLKEDRKEALDRLKEAVSRNPHVVSFLKAPSKLPKTAPDFYSPGSKDEAVCYLLEALETWVEYPEAVQFVLTEYRSDRD